ncbi:MAG: hypothetical protein RR356_04395 [Bacteroidales bacterium]
MIKKTLFTFTMRHAIAYNLKAQNLYIRTNQHLRTCSAINLLLTITCNTGNLLSVSSNRALSQESVANILVNLMTPISKHKRPTYFSVDPISPFPN